MTLSLDLTWTSIDYERLLALAQECGAKAGRLLPELAREAEAVLGSYDGEVLPGPRAP